jgi:hypothetical protein
VIAAVFTAGLGLVFGGCGSTEYFYEGAGVPPDRATGAVPPGALGVCRLEGTHRPLILNPKLWENAHVCTARTPRNYFRLGVSGESTTGPNFQAEQQNLLAILKEGQNETTGNNHLVKYMRALHDYGLKDPRLKMRVARDSSRPSTCDYTYILNMMHRERTKLEGDKCPATVYDQQVRTEVCLFDTTRPEVVWLTSSWSCVAQTGASEEQQSCHRLCGYDDYCAKQVNCTGRDVDLLLCALGVCLPELRAGIY